MAREIITLACTECETEIIQLPEIRSWKQKEGSKKILSSSTSPYYSS